MKKFLFITMVMLLSIVSITTYANTPCCNSKMNHCTKCAKGCDKSNCLDYCSKSCKASGECTTKCK
ncbi:MAG: hypothetical protein JWR38_4578 [Mucilaginibacter sp.]|nr:hypothetical protein [Mucilaginibacter sp.]